eukprot:COSAG02_NODE_45566_length_356_cov_0.595331_1_plen_26_part_01
MHPPSAPVPVVAVVIIVITIVEGNEV